eukprot:gene4111-5086_t
MEAGCVSTHGWAVGIDNVVLHTSDGGETWAAQRDITFLGQIWRGVSFADDFRGWVVGDRAQIISTVDGGVTWEALESGVDASYNFYAVQVVNGTDLWVVGDYGTVLHLPITAEGGTEPTFSLQSSNAQSAAQYALRTLHFVTPVVGYIAGEYGALVKTTDGGATWRSLATGSSGVILQGVYFKNATVGWLAGGAGLILYTEDGGEGNHGEVWPPLFTPPCMAKPGTAPSLLKLQGDEEIVAGYSRWGGSEAQMGAVDGWGHVYMETFYPVTDDLNFMSAAISGDEDYANGCLKGRLSEVYVWSRHLLLHELLITFNGFDQRAYEYNGLLGYFYLEEGEGDWVADVTQQNLDGFLGGDPQWVADAPLQSGWHPAGDGPWCADNGMLPATNSSDAAPEEGSAQYQMDTQTAPLANTSMLPGSPPPPPMPSPLELEVSVESASPEQDSHTDLVLPVAISAGLLLLAGAGYLAYQAWPKSAGHQSCDVMSNGGLVGSTDGQPAPVTRALVCVL